MAVATAAALVATLVVVTGSDDDELTPIAKASCDELEGAIVLQVGGILSSALRDAEDAGYSGSELGDKMREICPSMMAAVDSIGDEQEARDQLPSEMELDLGTCGLDDVTGTVTNNSDLRVDIFIEITFENSSNTQVGDSVASVSGLRPGQKATWEAYVPVDDYDTCRARVSSVFESD